jgi:hypothetical protein
MTRASGTEGYAEDGEAVLRQYERLAFEQAPALEPAADPAAGRRMFAVTADETTGLARQAGLDVVFNTDAPEGIQKRPGVSWTRLAFTRPGRSGRGSSP